MPMIIQVIGLASKAVVHAQVLAIRPGRADAAAKMAWRAMP